MRLHAGRDRAARCGYCILTSTTGKKKKRGKKGGGKEEGGSKKARLSNFRSLRSELLLPLPLEERERGEKERGKGCEGELAFNSGSTMSLPSLFLPLQRGEKKKKEEEREGAAEIHDPPGHH